MRSILVIVALLTVLSACGRSPAGPGSPTSTPAPAGSGPVITAFQIIDDVTCTGAQASVPVSWTTRDAQKVEFQVDRQPLSAGYPLSGIGNVTVPCDGHEHAVVLAASGSGTQVSIARHVNTSTGPPPANAPSITAFDVLDDVTCSGSTVGVAASWVTQRAQAVNFSVDGQPLSAAAGFPTTGAGNIPVPCDGNAHKVTLTAIGTGPPASLSRSVNTGNTPPPPPVGPPVITALQVIDAVTCTGTQASVPTAWATRNAQSVDFQVDGQPVPAGAGFPVNGVGNTPVPCDGRAHQITLNASGPGGQTSASRQVNTSNNPPPPTGPSISRFDLLDDVTCSTDTVDVPAAWATQNAQAVNFSVDGQPLSAAAGFPVTGVGRIQVPCDGKSHTVTLTATGAGAPASLARSVNTTTGG